MKTIKRTICLLLVALFLFSTLSFAYAWPDEDELQNPFCFQNEDQAKKSCDEYSALLDYYAKGEPYSDTSISYPDYYAGAYLNDNMELIVNVTHKNNAILNELIAATGSTELVVNIVQYSFSELMHTKEKIEAKLLTEERITVEVGLVFGVGLSIRNNTVNVYALSDTTIHDSSLIDILDKSDTSISVIYRDSTDTNAATVYPGNAIGNYYGGNYRSRSVGFWGYNSSGKIGFVTAPHSTMALNTVVYIGSNDFGKCNTPYYSGSTDGVFVERTNTTFTPSNYVSQWSTTIISHAYASLPEGAWVRARGMNTTTAGIVQDISYTTSYGISNTVLTSAIVALGDSGGVVIGLDTTVGNAFLVGIITGMVTSDGSMIYCKAYSIFTTLGLSVNDTPY